MPLPFDPFLSEETKVPLSKPQIIWCFWSSSPQSGKKCNKSVRWPVPHIKYWPEKPQLIKQVTNQHSPLPPLSGLGWSHLLWMRWLGLVNWLAGVHLGPGERGHPNAEQAQTWKLEFLAKDQWSHILRPGRFLAYSMSYNDFRFFSYQSTSIQKPRGKDLEKKAFLRGFVFVLCFPKPWL